MCGINLSYGKENIIRMNQLLGHRGIRAKYVELKDDFYIGHVRLPIQGVNQRWDQPLEGAGITGALVGEVLNFHEFGYSNENDLPTIMGEFIRRGRDAFWDFDGFWAVVIYNQLTDNIHIYTDYLAKKPLYMRRDPFAVSSEIKALVPLGPTTFDRLYFASVSKWGYCPDTLTPFKEIWKIPEGTEVTYNIKENTIGFDTYMTMKPKAEDPLSTLLENSVKNRAVSDVPISILMSGGLDSTIIYYLLREYIDELTIFHIDNEERYYLNQIDFREKDKIIPISLPDEPPEDQELRQILFMNDGPVDLGSMIQQYYLSREIKKHGIRVCLSGDGADELFGGYRRAKVYDSQYSDIFHELVYYHLPRLDKMMMAHTVELRCPFLARPIIEWSMGLPWKLRTEKQLLKKWFGHLIPEKILNRKKKALKHSQVIKNKNAWRYRLIDIYKDLYKWKGVIDEYPGC